MLEQLFQDYGSQLLSALIPAIVAAFFASGWWQSRKAWLKTLVAAFAKGAVAQTEVDYVIPKKEESGESKLTPTQQQTAKTMASVSIKDALTDVGVAALSATGPIISAAVEKAVANMKKTLPDKTQRLFPD